MRRLIAEGKSIILITHKLKEIMEVSDRVTIIRKGEGIGTVVTAATNPDQLAEMMVGRQVEFKTEKRMRHQLTKCLQLRTWLLQIIEI